MDTYQLFPDGLDEECGDDGTVHSARQCEENLLVPYLLANRCNLLFDEFLSQFRSGYTNHVIRTLVWKH